MIKLLLVQNTNKYHSIPKTNENDNKIRSKSPLKTSKKSHNNNNNSLIKNPHKKRKRR